MPSDSLEPVLPTSIININFCPKREPGTESAFGNGPWIILASKLENIWDTPSWQRHENHADDFPVYVVVFLCLGASPGPEEFSGRDAAIKSQAVTNRGS